MPDIRLQVSPSLTFTRRTHPTEPANGCRHVTFRDMHAHNPTPGELPDVVRGRCRDCDGVRFLDRQGNIYRTARDAQTGENVEVTRRIR